MIFIYEPQREFGEGLVEALNKESYKFRVFDDKQSLGSAIKEEIPLVVFYDLRFDKEIPRLLEKIYLENPEIILLGTAEMHLEMFEQFTDQIFLPHVSFEQIVDGIADHINDRKLLASCDFVGRSVELIGVARMIEQVAPTDITVLITGPSGAGKEMVAKAIHTKSTKADEIFGHFEQASKGTLFLDEIGELPPDLQVKLLRVLEDKSFYRVGGKEKISTNARLIFATNKNLEDEVAAGRFRQDLYYRLNVVNIAVLPLIARPKDIPSLVKEFIKKSRYGDFTRGNPIEPGAMKLFLKYHWPGNARELRNVVESLLILSKKGVITQAAFEKYLQEKSLH